MFENQSLSWKIQNEVKTALKNNLQQLELNLLFQIQEVNKTFW